MQSEVLLWNILWHSYRPCQYHTFCCVDADPILLGLKHCQKVLAVVKFQSWFTAESRDSGLLQLQQNVQHFHCPLIALSPS